MEPKVIAEDIEVDVPIDVAYQHWQRVEEFPRFMEGIEEVRPLGGNRTHWKGRIGGKQVEWTAEIRYEEPEKTIIWRADKGAANIGRIEFEPISGNRTRIRAAIQYEPGTAIETLGSLFGIPESRVRGDLQRFKEHVEAKGRAAREPTGAYAGSSGPGYVATGMDTPGERRRRP